MCKTELMTNTITAETSTGSQRLNNGITSPSFVFAEHHPVFSPVRALRPHLVGVVVAIGDADGRLEHDRLPGRLERLREGGDLRVGRTAHAHAVHEARAERVHPRAHVPLLHVVVAG